MASAIKKVNMISKIVRLRQVVKRWKFKSLRGGGFCYSSDESSASNRRTPSGSIAVYVGPEHRRFVIPTRFLNLPVFVSLLNQAEEEFGFQSTGGLALPCDTVFFTEILRFLEEDEEKFREQGLDEFLKMVYDVGYNDKSSCNQSSSSCHNFTPLLQKTGV